MAGITKEHIVERIGKLNEDLNGAIGRLTSLRPNDIRLAEAHEIVLKIGMGLDDLINYIQGGEAS